jgi:hypothetical protein
MAFKEKPLESSKPVIATKRVSESIVAKTVKKTILPGFLNHQPPVIQNSV